MSEVQEEEKLPQSETLQLLPVGAERGWVQRLKNKANKVLKREQEPGSPQLSIDIFYSPHRTEKDIEGLESRFQKADIFFPESSGWTPDGLEYYQKLSRGEMTPEEVLRLTGWNPHHPFYTMRLRELGIIHGSNKLIDFVDIPHGHRIEQEFEEVTEVKISDNFDDTLDSVRNFIQSLARVEREREEYITSEIPIKIKEILDESPHLKKKKVVVALLHLGGAHTLVFHDLKRRGLETTREFATRPFIFSYRDEALRNYMFGKPISRELLAQVWLEREFYIGMGAELEKITRNTKEYDVIMRRIMSQFNFDEIKGICSAVSKGENFQNAFESRLQQKGLKVPQSEAELDLMLTNK